MVFPWGIQCTGRRAGGNRCTCHRRGDGSGQRAGAAATPPSAFPKASRGRQQIPHGGGGARPFEIDTALFAEQCMARGRLPGNFAAFLTWGICVKLTDPPR